MTKLLSSIITLLLSIVIYGQVDRVIQFDAVLSGGKTIITWTVGAGSTCESVVVQRSTDSINFRDIYTYPSICGNSTVDEKYSWIDQSPIPCSLSYYRLKIENVDFTSTRLVDNNSRIKRGELSIYPNPSAGRTEFWFEQLSNKSYQIQFYNSKGQLEFENKLLNTNSFELDVSFLSSGFYWVLILDENGTPAYSSKLLVI
tara:strand:- start:3053 stop:3655 length:603 start_codon:yes stop_codon:yes gene_type:complete